jgi:hypothetical protein
MKTTESCLVTETFEIVIWVHFYGAMKPDSHAFGGLGEVCLVAE